MRLLGRVPVDAERVLDDMPAAALVGAGVVVGAVAGHHSGGLISEKKWKFQREIVKYYSYSKNAPPYK
jgi:hypothetical protein